MKKHQKITIERFVTLCDRCGCVLDEEGNPFEWQVHFAVRFRAGYGSVFEDGYLVEGDFCQSCIAKTLGKYLRVTEDHPFVHQHELTEEPRRLFQPEHREVPE